MIHYLTYYYYRNFQKRISAFLSIKYKRCQAPYALTLDISKHGLARILLISTDYLNYLYFLSVLILGMLCMPLISENPWFLFIVLAPMVPGTRDAVAVNTYFLEFLASSLVLLAMAAQILICSAMNRKLISMRKPIIGHTKINRGA